MKRFVLSAVIFAAVGAGAVTVHRSFQNGYPSEVQSATALRYQNQAVLTAPKTKKRQTTVVTNRVVISREQAEKLMKNNQRYKKVKTVPASGSITNAVPK